MTHDIRRITIDHSGHIYEVTHMFDKQAKLINDPALASTCVVIWCGQAIEQDTDYIPIYTVH